MSQADSDKEACVYIFVYVYVYLHISLYIYICMYKNNIVNIHTHTHTLMRIQPRTQPVACIREATCYGQAEAPEEELFAGDSRVLTLSPES